MTKNLIATTRLTLFAGLLGLAAATPAWAQVHLQLVGGGTRMADTNIFLGGRLGARVAVIEIDVEGGRLRDVLPRGLFDAINRLQEELTPGRSVVISLPANYVKGSLRLIGPAGPVKPFVGAGIGMARVQPHIEANTGNDVIDAILDTDIFKAENKTLATIDAGLRFDLPKVMIDVGYRYWRVFTDYRRIDELGDLGDDVLVNVNSVFLAAGVKF